jgi:hypothetical protein
MRTPTVLLSLVLLFSLALHVRASEPKIDLQKLPPAARGKMDFVKDIEPILKRSCVDCHGPTRPRGGLRLDHGDLALKGSNSGKVLVPGKATESRLLIVVSGLDPETRMPPKEKPQLTRDEVGKLRAWIDQGAVWPSSSSAKENVASTHWSFQPIRRPQLPQLKPSARLRNAIDYFILQRLDKEKIAPSPEADRATLLRRLSFDLLGLPPTPRDVEDFVKDTRSDAYERLVDRLLSSPNYGERWGRHWLDLARYADSDGYEADRPRPFAWRYRAWVIDALNRDLPFDQFTIEQLAGDLLPNATLAQKTATGFHRNTLTNKEGGTDKEQFRVEACVDRVNTTAKAFLGLTLGCAQCHDHKYDPFSQREYYEFFAFFNSDSEVDLAAPLAGSDEVYRKAKAAFDKKKADLEANIAATVNNWADGLTPGQLTKLPANVQASLKVAASERSDKQAKVLADYHAKTDKSLLALNKGLAAHLKTSPSLPTVPTLSLGKARKTHIMIRGDFLRPGVAVQPGTPAVLKKGTQLFSATPTRLDLARWITGPDNPLTARVISNWVWHRYFGRGLVATPEDFGTQGEKPSHPELLDFLASEFMQQKWSLKQLHKLIVTSATYRQSSRHRSDVAAKDPMNILLARQTRVRLDAEVLRDNALAVSGLLAHNVGGPSVKPPQPPGISELTYANAAKWVESKGADRYRRGLYIWFQRTSPYPMLMTFDATDGVLCSVRREKSNTPLQALTLLNDAVFVECAQALGRRIVSEVKGMPRERLEHAFRLCVARPPTNAERDTLLELYDELATLARANPKEAAQLLGNSGAPSGVDAAEAAAWVAMARALMNLDEFVTRE